MEEWEYALRPCGGARNKLMLMREIIDMREDIKAFCNDCDDREEKDFKGRPLCNEECPLFKHYIRASRAKNLPRSASRGN